MPSNFVAKGADGYEAIMGRWSRRLATPFLDFSGVPSRGRVLDAGCGTGSMTLALAAHPGLASIEALDFDENFVAALRRRTTDPRIRAQQGDVCALPYGDQEFDGVYSLLVLHFVSDPHRAVREMRRVLRPGATAAATVWDNYGGMAHRALGARGRVGEDSAAARPGPEQDDFTPSNGGASVRDDKGLDGCDALPDAKTTQGRDRDGAECARLQYETCNSDSGLPNTAGGDANVRDICTPGRRHSSPEASGCSSGRLNRAAKPMPDFRPAPKEVLTQPGPVGDVPGRSDDVRSQG